MMMRARFHMLAALLCATMLAAGCAGVKVGSISPAEYLAQRRGDILTTGKLSTSAQEVLRVIGSDADLCRKDGQACRNALADSPGLSDEQRLSALSEVWLQVALASEKHGGATDAAAIEAWFETARHAYAYLFFTARKPRDRAFEDRQTQVRDYYNYAVQQAITGLYDGVRRNGSRAVAQPAMPKVGDWRIETDVSNLRLPSDTPLPDELIPAASLTFSGLRNTYRRDGFGAELVAADSQRTDEKAPAFDTADPRPPYREMPFPAVTALLLFDGGNLAEVLATRTLRRCRCTSIASTATAGSHNSR